MVTNAYPSTNRGISLNSAVVQASVDPVPKKWLNYQQNLIAFRILESVYRHAFADFAKKKFNQNGPRLSKKPRKNIRPLNPLFPLRKATSLWPNLWSVNTPCRINTSICFFRQAAHLQHNRSQMGVVMCLQMSDTLSNMISRLPPPGLEQLGPSLHSTHENTSHTSIL